MERSCDTHLLSFNFSSRLLRDKPFLRVPPSFIKLFSSLIFAVLHFDTELFISFLKFTFPIYKFHHKLESMEKNLL